MMPSTPRSSERAVRPRTSDSTRTSACTPADDAPSSWPSSSDSSPPPCSRSTCSQSKPARPSVSAASGEPSVKNVPNSVSPAARRAFIGVSGVIGRHGTEQEPRSPDARVRGTVGAGHGDTMSTSTDTQSRTLHAADSHDMIRVLGARVNNLKNVSLEIPKRRLTVFTGVSGSGKSSLVFGTIAAESQRLINETYSAFVQGFMPTLARPEVDVLEGLTTAILVDQERMGSNPRSTVGTATDANAMLRILFSRLGEPHIGSPNAYSFNVPSVRATGSITVERGDKKTEKVTFTRTGGMCPRCEGRGTVSNIDLTALYDDSKSLNEGALTIPGYSMDGWYGRIFKGCGFFDPDKPIRKYTKKERSDLLYKE